MMAAVVTKKLEGKHVLYMLLGFFGVMVTVNMILVYFALTSFSGLSEEDPYNKGLKYNEAIEAMQAQKARNWVANISLNSKGDAALLLNLELLDHDGQPVKAQKVVATFRHPAKEGQDLTITLNLTPDGYSAFANLPRTGQWNLAILVTGGGYETPYRVEKRVWVK